MIYVAWLLEHQFGADLACERSGVGHQNDRLMSVGLCLRLNVNIFLSYYIVLNTFTPCQFAFLQSC